MKKITIATFIGFTNRGSEALLRTRISAIRKYIPDAQFYVLTVYKDSCKSIDGVEYIQTFGGQREKFKSPVYLLKSLVMAIIWSLEIFRFKLTKTASLSDIKKIANSEMFISTDGDVLGEDYGLLPYIWRIYYLSIGLILKKPVIIFAEGLGPFRSKIGILISKLFFKRCAYLSVRDEFSYDNIMKLGINREVDIVADSAFLLEPSNDPNLNYKIPGKKLIGIAVSELATKYGFKYKDEPDSYKGFLNLMSSVIDWLIIKQNAEVILIPHVVQIKRDDYQTAQDILGLVKNKNSVKIISKEYNAMQLKKIISHCDLLIASRMHAAIAGLSSGVPVIGIAYSHKMKGIFDLMNINSVIDIKKLDYDLISLINYNLKNYLKINKELLFRSKIIKKLALKPANAVYKILKN